MSGDLRRRLRGQKEHRRRLVLRSAQPPRRNPEPEGLRGSLHRKAARGFEGRLIGGHAWSIGVSVGPGAMAFTVTPRLASSNARHLVSIFTPALVTQ
jgi:hypothetical protein